MNKPDGNQNITKAPLLPSCRLLLGFMVMIAVMFLYLLRIILSISMICMIKPPVGAAVNCSALVSDNSTISALCSDPNSTWSSNTTLPATPHRGEFEWSRQYQGTILSSYFYGYMSTQILGGVLSGKYGAKHVLGTGILISVILTLITPAATRLSSHLLVAIRIGLGAAGGVFLPCSQSFWGRWAPVNERSVLVSLSFLGITLGNIVAYLISPLLCGIELDNGWPWSFYVTGFAGIVFYIAWNLLVYSSPDEHPRVSEREKACIKASIGSSTISERPPVPWLKILTSPAVWAILVAQTCNTWFLFTSITLPLYMKDVLNFNIKENGLFLCIPYMIDMVTLPLAGQLSDLLRRKKILRTIVLRKVFQTISCVGSSTLLIVLSLLDYDRRYTAVAVLSMIYPIQNLCRSGYGVNPQDIAPRFSGEIFGLTTTAGTISGIISPVVVGALTTNGTREDWQKVFFISSGFFIFGGLFFLIFARGEIQPWAVTEKPTDLRLIESPDEKKAYPEKNEKEKMKLNGSRDV
jgi:MFS family permease